MTTNILAAEDSRARWGWVIMVLLGGMAVAAIVLSPQTGWLVVGLVGALVFLSLASEVFKGRIDQLLLYWVALFPLGGLLAFPRGHAVVSLSRMVLFLAVVGLMFAKRSALVPIPRPLSNAGLACLAFIAVAGVSLLKLPDLLYPARILNDCFIEPFCFVWIVVAWFDVRRWLSRLHTALCMSCIISASIAAAEVVTGQDILPDPGAKLDFAGSIPRPNGPFASNDELALIGGISLFLLLFLRVALGRKISAGRRFLHSIGLTAAVGMTLMPMFRSILITLVIVLLIDIFWQENAGARVGRIALIAAIAASIFVGSIYCPRSSRTGAAPITAMRVLLSTSRTSKSLQIIPCLASDLPTSTTTSPKSPSMLRRMKGCSPSIGPIATLPRS